MKNFSASKNYIIRRCVIGLFLLLPAFLCVHISYPGSKVSEAVSIEIKTDPRVELMGIIFRLAGRPEYNQGVVTSYNNYTDTYFGKFSDHEVVRLASKLTRNRGISFDAVMNMAVHIKDAVDLEEKVPFDPRPASLDKRWEVSEARQFLEAARNFVRETNFSLFYSNREDIYNITLERVRKLLDEKAKLDWFDRFFGSRSGAKFVIIPGLTNGRHSYGVRVRVGYESEEIYSILGVWALDKNGAPLFEKSVVSTIIHEFCHSYVNPLIDKYEASFKKAGESLFPYVGESMNRQHYGDWKIMMYESVIRACVVRYLQYAEGTEAARKAILEEVKNKFAWMDDLVVLLGEYESNRVDFPTFESFIPKIAAFFDRYSNRLDQAPKVTDIIPGNGATDVDPGLQFVIISFDRPMRDQSWSIIAGGETALQLNGKPYYQVGHMSLIIPVKLRPGWNYDFWLNSEEKMGFMSKTGVPLVPMRVSFKTRGSR